MGHGIYGPFLLHFEQLFKKVAVLSIPTSEQKVEKKAVLIRVPGLMYEDLLNLSAAATLLQRKSVSVPGLILEILEEALKHRRHR